MRSVVTMQVVGVIEYAADASNKAEVIEFGGGDLVMEGRYNTLHRSDAYGHTYSLAYPGQTLVKFLNGQIITCSPGVVLCSAETEGFLEPTSDPEAGLTKWVVS